MTHGLMRMRTFRLAPLSVPATVQVNGRFKPMLVPACRLPPGREYGIGWHLVTMLRYPKDLQSVLHKLLDPKVVQVLATG
jgi:hypothetical protein